MPDAPRVGEGDVLRGKYRVERVLGSGGMGTVVLAVNVKLGQRVAVKVLHGATGDPYAVERFVREARSAARIENDHVVRILDVDETVTGAPFLVMEYLSGADLGMLLNRDGRLSVERAVGLVLEACEGVAAAHALGIVHRDLKPSNLFLATRADGTKTVKLLDFGISKPTGSPPDDIALTDTRTTVGSPPFMSPEQLRSSKDIDARTDVWSLGVTLYELLSGSLPFKGTTTASLAAQIAADPPAQIPAAIPPALEQVISKCLEKLPDNRYAGVAELADALAEFTPDGKALAERVARARTAVGRESSKERVEQAEEEAPRTASIGAKEEVSPVRVEGAPTATGFGTTIGATPSAFPQSRRRAQLIGLAAGMCVAALFLGARAVWRAPAAPTTASSTTPPSPIVTPTVPSTPALTTAPTPAPTPTATAVATASASSAPKLRSPRRSPSPRSSDPMEVELK
jgi:serine/threonine-protein kinase